MSAAVIHIKIDDLDVLAKSGTTIFQAAENIGVKMPDLCEFSQKNGVPDCPICVVEVEGIPQLLLACKTIIWDGMVVCTDNHRIRHARKVNMMFLASGLGCQECSRQAVCPFAQELENDGIFQVVPPLLCHT